MKIFVVIFLLFTLSASCKEDTQEEQDCGCESPIVSSIEESQQQEGYLYRITDTSDEATYPEIEFTVYNTDCINCKHTYLICNPEVLSHFEQVPAYPGTKVKFSGHVRKVCTRPTAPADYTYNKITLTSIEKL